MSNALADQRMADWSCVHPAHTHGTDLAISTAPFAEYEHEFRRYTPVDEPVLVHAIGGSGQVSGLISFMNRWDQFSVGVMPSIRTRMRTPLQERFSTPTIIVGFVSFKYPKRDQPTPVSELRSHDDQLRDTATHDSMSSVVYRLPAAEQNAHVRVVDELRDLLGLTYDELHAITGIAKNTFHHWRREHSTPRNASVRKLLRLQSLVRAVIAHVGRDAAIKWFTEGPTPPLEALLRGDLDSAERAAHALLFRRTRDERRAFVNHSAFIAEPDLENEGAEEAAGSHHTEEPHHQGR